VLLSRLAVQTRRVLAADEACVLVVDTARLARRSARAVTSSLGWPERLFAARRTTEWTYAIAIRFGLDEAALIELELAARLSELGRARTPRTAHSRSRPASRRSASFSGWRASAGTAGDVPMAWKPTAFPSRAGSSPLAVS
jgi:hypothetical protein